MGKPNESTPASMQGTAEHECAAECLIHGIDPVQYLGRVFVFLPDREEMWLEALPAERHSQIKYRVVLDDDAIDRVEAYVFFVRDLVARLGGVLLVEKRVPIDHLTGEEGAGGTTDVAILTPLELIVVDYKSGQERVDAYEVLKPASFNIITGVTEPEVRGPNLQLAHYGSGTLRMFGWMIPDVKSVRLIIVQPRLPHPISEHAMSVEEFHQHCMRIRELWRKTYDSPEFVPSESNCHFCLARFDCKAREDHVLGMALEGFVPGDCQSLIEARPRPIDGKWLGAVYSKIGMLKQFIKDYHVKVFTELAAGRPVIDADGEPLKLVQGRGGNRFFVNEDIAKLTLLSFGLSHDEVTTTEVRSPSQLEALTKGKRQGKGLPMIPPRLNKDQWAAVSMLIAKPPGKPAIAKASDERAAIRPALDGFTDFSTLVEDDQDD